MSLVLVRVDDRLIHGQVVVGWGHALGPDLLVLADDEIAGNEWECELYGVGVPSELEVEFATVQEASAHADEWQRSARKTILLVGDVDSLIRLCQGAPEIHEVNLGGVHQSGDRLERLPYLFLSDRELGELRRLRQRGVRITAQDLPNATPVSIDEIA